MDETQTHKNGRHKQGNQANLPHDEKNQHRIEVFAYFFLTCWISADILSVFGNSRLAVIPFYFALLLPLGLLTHHAHKAWPAWKKHITWGFCAVFCVLPIFLFFVSYLATFSVFASPSLLSKTDTRNSIPLFWFTHVRSAANGVSEECSPVYVILFVKFINERDSLLSVEGYSVETKAPNGNWVKMPVLDVHPKFFPQADFYFVQFINGLGWTPLNLMPDFKHAQRLDFHDNYLQSRIFEKPLAPHESVQGWLMLDIPPDGWTHQLRFKIAAEGKTFSKPINFTNLPTNEMQIQMVQPLSTWVVGETRDISHLPVRYYGDGMQIIPNMKTGTN